MPYCTKSYNIFNHQKYIFGDAKKIVFTMH